MNEASEYRSGTPSFDEYRGPWKAEGDEESFTQEEFYAAYDSLYGHIIQFGKVGFMGGCDFFIIGSILEDKTQCIEFVNPAKLTIDFIHQIQQWIAQAYPYWRVFIPTYLDPNAIIIIYRDSVRLPRDYEENVEKGLRSIREKM